MEIRAIGNWLLLFSSLSLLWSGSSRQLLAGQNNSRQDTELAQPAPATSPSQKVDPAEAADIRQLLDIEGINGGLTFLKNTREDAMKQRLLHVLPPGAYRERFVELYAEKFNETLTPQKVVNLAIPVYAKYFSDDEIKGLIQFFKTPLGQKWISAEPKVEAGMALIARVWGRDMRRQLLVEVLKEHPDLAREFRAAYKAAHSH